MTNEHGDSKLVRFAHGALVFEVNVGVLILVKNDAVAAHLLRSLDFLSKLPHWNQSRLSHNLLNVELCHS